MFIDTFKTYWREVRVVLIIVAIGGVWYCINDYLDTKHKLASAIAENSTLQSEFKKIGDSYQTQNKLFQDKQDKQQQAIDALGQATVSAMRESRAELQSLYTAMGVISSNVASLKGTNGGNRDDKTGLVSGVTAVQDRNGLPPLTSLSINYDPAKSVDKAFNGSQWLNNKEVFNVSLGEWQLKDGGYRATMRLNRDVFDQKTGQKVGSEEVPLTEANASFDSKKFQKYLDDPRFTFTLGATHYAPNGKWYPMGLIDYRFTQHWGISVGAVNQGAALGLSYRFDIK